MPPKPDQRELRSVTQASKMHSGHTKAATAQPHTAWRGPGPTSVRRVDCPPSSRGSPPGGAMSGCAKSGSRCGLEAGRESDTERGRANSSESEQEEGVGALVVRRSSTEGAAGVEASCERSMCGLGASRRRPVDERANSETETER